jgi:ABC-type antimicrobial peptide transport system permease subunit
VLAHAVARQTPEIGLRIALGATRAGVVGPLLRRTLVLTACGITLGVAASAAVTRILTSLLFEVSPIDPYAFAGVPVLLVAVAMLACWAPARRAAKVDPLVALRAD